jgi:hypothetical protein
MPRTEHIDRAFIYYCKSYEHEILATAIIIEVLRCLITLELNSIDRMFYSTIRGIRIVILVIRDS